MSLLIGILLAIFVLPSPWGIIVVIAALFLEAAEITWGLRLARRRSHVGVETLIGRTATVVRALDPVGQVTLNGERWGARSATHAPEGAKVVVEEIDGLELVVRPERMPGRAPGGRGSTIRP